MKENSRYTRNRQLHKSQGAARVNEQRGSWSNTEMSKRMQASRMPGGALQVSHYLSVPAGLQAAAMEPKILDPRMLDQHLVAQYLHQVLSASDVEQASKAADFKTRVAAQMAHPLAMPLSYQKRCSSINLYANLKSEQPSQSN